jgi:hypothetical protein
MRDSWHKQEQIGSHKRSTLQVQVALVDERHPWTGRAMWAIIEGVAIYWAIVIPAALIIAKFIAASGTKF